MSESTSLQPAKAGVCHLKKQDLKNGQLSLMTVRRFLNILPKSLQVQIIFMKHPHFWKKLNIRKTRFMLDTNNMKKTTASHFRQNVQYGRNNEHCIFFAKKGVRSWFQVPPHLHRKRNSSMHWLHCWACLWGLFLWGGTSWSLWCCGKWFLRKLLWNQIDS